MTALGICGDVPHFWEGIAILVGLGIWIGAAGMWQYLKRHPERIIDLDDDPEEESAGNYHRWFLPVIDLGDLDGVPVE